LFPEEKTMREYTISIVQSFLRRYDGNVLKVAEKLDIGKSTIYKMIQEKEIVP
jgi:transcriptional regulator with PAS, ATPase and Fis domain